LGYENGGDEINYLMIPKDVMYDLELGKNRVILFSFFATKRSLDDSVGFCIDDLVTWCGYKINHHKGKINEKFQELIWQLSEKKYINVISININNIHSSVDINHDKFDIPNNFALVYFDEIDKIKSYSANSSDRSKANAAILLLVLSYIRVNMLRRQEKYFSNPFDKPEFCYRMYKDIETDIGLSSRYISKAVSILSDIGLITTHTLPRYKDEFGTWHTEVTLFVNKYRRTDNGEVLDEKYDCHQELQWGVEYITQKKYLSKKFNQDVGKS
jgi:hypothetical protein